MDWSPLDHHHSGFGHKIERSGAGREVSQGYVCGEDPAAMGLRNVKAVEHVFEL